MIPTPALYDTTIEHSRTERLHHAFAYRHAMWLIDLDHVPTAPGGLTFLGSFSAADHLGEPAATLRENVDAYLHAEGHTPPGGRVLMLANARALGHVFNPLTVYWCFDVFDEVRFVVAEVHNTHGERHRYLLQPDADGVDEVDKAFYVSPFFDVDGRYEIRVPEPSDVLEVAVTLRRGDRTVFGAVMHGRRRRAGFALSALVRNAWASWRVSVLIRFQGIRLWARGVPVVPWRAAEPQRTSRKDTVS